jgi:hypothetical protein
METLKCNVLFLALLPHAGSFLSMLAFAADADPIQDFCVADATSTTTLKFSTA